MGNKTAFGFAAGGLAAAVLSADQAAKAAVRNSMKPGERKFLAPGTERYVIVDHVQNYGMAGNMGDKNPETVRNLSAAMTGAAAAALLATDAKRRAAAKKDRKIRPLLPVREAGLSLLLGGAVSNTLDRVRDGYVTDYVSFRSGVPFIDRYSFNIADAAILTGTITAAATAGSGNKTAGELGRGAIGAAAFAVRKSLKRKKRKTKKRRIR